MQEIKKNKKKNQLKPKHPLPKTPPTKLTIP